MNRDRGGLSWDSKFLIIVLKTFKQEINFGYRNILRHLLQALQIIICLCKTNSTFSLSLVSIAETFQRLPCKLSDMSSYQF